MLVLLIFAVDAMFNWGLHRITTSEFGVYSPEYYETQAIERNRKEILAKANELAARFGFALWDYSESPIWRYRSNFYNSHHLNRNGASVFSKEFGKPLVETGLVDRRMPVAGTPAAINTIDYPTFVQQMIPLTPAWKACRAATFFLFSVLLPTGPVSAQIIPDNRTAPWQGNVGVPGGIPVRTTIYKNIVTDLGADPTGATDCSTIIQNALAACPQNQVVYIPAGTFRISALTNIPYSTSNNRTLRGAGMGRTILKCDNGVQYVLAIGTTGGGGTPTNHHITAGATKGSNTITIDDTTDFTVGGLMSIQPATPTWAHVLSFQNYTANRIITVTFKVRSKTSTTVTFDPPCPFDFSGMSPVALAYYVPNNYFLPVTGFGIEDMTFNLSSDASNFCAVEFTDTWGCWMKNIEVVGATSRYIYCNSILRCEFRGLYHHDEIGSGSDHEGLDFVTGCCWNLVEDCIFGPNGGAPPVILGDGGGGCVGNVFGYNYCFGNSATGYYDISLNHGAHNMLNLVEGNSIQNYQDDGYFGSCSHNTLFRNRILATIRLKHYSTYYSVVGNVLGHIQDGTPYPPVFQASGNPGPPAAVFQLGYPNAGNNGYNGSTIGPTDPPDYHLEPWHLLDNNPAGSGPGAQALDLNVEATLIRHGNFDYVHHGVVWDSSISDHTLPASLYYSSKPAWWPGGVAWPPIGPDCNPIAGEIPAQIRYHVITQGGPDSSPEHLRVMQ